MYDLREMRIGTVIWLSLLFCLSYLIVYFFLFLFQVVISENFHYDLFARETGALVQMVVAVVGASTIMYMSMNTQILETNVKLANEKKDDKEVPEDKKKEPPVESEEDKAYNAGQS